MVKNLKELVNLFNEDQNIQEKINNKTWEGQRLSIIGEILQTFAQNPEIKSLVFHYQNYDLNPNNYLNINNYLTASVNFYPEKTKDLKTCFFTNEQVSHKFSNIKFQILPDLKKEELVKTGYLKFTCMLDSKIPNKNFYEEVFSLSENTYPLFQYFLLNEKINNKTHTNISKKKI